MSSKVKLIQQENTFFHSWLTFAKLVLRCKICKIFSLLNMRKHRSQLCIQTSICAKLERTKATWSSPNHGLKYTEDWFVWVPLFALLLLGLGNLLKTFFLLCLMNAHAVREAFSRLLCFLLNYLHLYLSISHGWCYDDCTVSTNFALFTLKCVKYIARIRWNLWHIYFHIILLTPQLIGVKMCTQNIKYCFFYSLQEGMHNFSIEFFYVFCTHVIHTPRKDCRCKVCLVNHAWVIVTLSIEVIFSPEEKGSLTASQKKKSRCETWGINIPDKTG